MYFDEVGPQLSLVRRARHLSQEAIAHRAGVSRAVLSNLECGQGNPTLKTLTAIAAALNVHLEVNIIDGKVRPRRVIPV